jgi:hypothetical protein
VSQIPWDELKYKDGIIHRSRDRILGHIIEERDIICKYIDINKDSEIITVQENFI